MLERVGIWYNPHRHLCDETRWLVMDVAYMAS